jgi:putative lipoic acid-binding regulatory protein
VATTLELDFPTEWSYKIIVNSGVDANSIVFELLDRSFQIREGNKSKNAKYRSYNLKLTVESKEQKDSIFHKLKAHRDIKMVL